LKKFLVVGVALLVAIPATVAVGGSSRDRTTGGGQILIGDNAGNTIAWTAQQIAPGSTAAKGEVQYINREGPTNVRQHGEVICVVTEGGPNGTGMAEVVFRDKRDTSQNPDTDQLYIVDNGEPNQGQDVVFVDETPTSPCSFEDDDDDQQVSLGRGNAQVYDAD
jgi:hypothetical protein